MSNSHIQTELSKLTVFTGLNCTGKTQRLSSLYNDFAVKETKEVHVKYIACPRGIRGYSKGSALVNPAFYHPSSSDESFAQQMNAWMKDIFPGINFTSKSYSFIHPPDFSLSP